MKITQNIIERIKVFLQNYIQNESHTLSADIKEFIATYIISVWCYIVYILPKRDEFKRTKELKNVKKGKKCFVFANGPSMKLLDVEKIKQYQKAGFDVICVNLYIITDMADTVVPNYYVLSDPVSFNLNSTSDDVLINKKITTRITELNIPLFIPSLYSNLNIIKQYCKQYYIFNDFENRFTRNIDLIKPRGYLSMTAYKAIAIACYLGYDFIYICGFDNDYFKSICVDENNNIYYTDTHYYDTGIKRRVTPGWYKGYVGKGLGNLLWEHCWLFKDMELFSNYNIIHLNKNSLIDAFSKKHDLDIYKDDDKNDK